MPTDLQKRDRMISISHILGLYNCLSLQAQVSNKNMMGFTSYILQ